MYNLKDIQNHFLVTFRLFKSKPYLPFWGEFFYIIHKVKREFRNSKDDIFLYELDINQKVFYQIHNNKVRLELSDFNILLNEQEFIDGLLQGRFWPISLNVHSHLYPDRI